MMGYTLYRQERPDGPYRVLRDYDDQGAAMIDARQCAIAEDTICLVANDHDETVYRYNGRA